MKSRCFVICFLFFTLCSCSAFAVAADANAERNLVPDPCSYICVSKIVAFNNTSSEIKELLDLLGKVNRSRIIPDNKQRNDYRKRQEMKNGDLPKLYSDGDEVGCEMAYAYPDKLAHLKAKLCLNEILLFSYKRLNRIKANDLNEILSPFQYPLAVGDIGRMHGREAESKHLVVLGIVDSNNCRALFYLGNKIEVPVWLDGIPTANLVDGSVIDPPPFMRVTGTRDYLTPYHDKKTVFVLERFTP